MRTTTFFSTLIGVSLTFLWLLTAPAVCQASPQNRIFYSFVSAGNSLTVTINYAQESFETLDATLYQPRILDLRPQWQNTHLQLDSTELGQAAISAQKELALQSTRVTPENAEWSESRVVIMSAGNTIRVAPGELLILHFTILQPTSSLLKWRLENTVIAPQEAQNYLILDNAAVPAPLLPTLIMGSLSGFTGKTVTIPLRLTNYPGVDVAGFQCDIGYDGNAFDTPVPSLGPAADVAGKSLSHSFPAPGKLRLMVIGMNVTNIADGVVANIDFPIKAAALAGNYPLALSDYVGTTAEATSVTMTNTDGGIAIYKDKPSLTTQAATGITDSSATGHGAITTTGGENATARGLCWGLNTNPTTDNNKTTENGNFSVGAFTGALTGLTPNTTYHVRAYATNSQGTAYGEDAQLTTLIDTTAPDAPQVAGATPTNDTTPTWSWTSGLSAGNGTFRLKLDNAELGSGATQTTALAFTPDSALAPGSHTLYVQERDAAGNWSDSGSLAIVIDITAPDAPQVAGATPTNDTTPTWSWTSGLSAGNGTFRLKLDDANLGSGATQTSALVFTPDSALAPGSHTLYVQERDAAGNWSDSGSLAIVIDTTAPDAVSAGDNRTANSTITQSGAAIDSSALTYAWTKESGPGVVIFGTPAALSSTITASSDGAYTIRFTATDAAGNSASSTMTLTWDSSSPAISGVNSSTAPGAYPAGGEINVLLGFTEPINSTGLNIELSSGASLTTGALTNQTSWSGTYTVAEGQNSSGLNIVKITGSISDPAGNNSVNPGIAPGQNLADHKALVIDSAAPQVSAGDILNSNALITHTGTATDANAMTYAWSQQSGPGAITFGAANQLSTTIAASSDGVYVLRLTAIDAAGNSAFSDLALVWDTSAPTVSIGAPSVTVTRSGPVIYTITYQNADTVTLAEADITLHKTGSAEGALQISASGTLERTVTISGISGDGTLGLGLGAGTAHDLAGNAAPSVNAGTSVTVDNTAPQVSAGANQQKNALFTQTGTASDMAGTGVQSSAWSKVSGPGSISFGSPDALATTVTASLDGTYTLRLTALDAAGNAATSDMTLVWDATPPLINAFTIPGKVTNPARLLAITSLVASDNMGVTGYCLTTTDNTAACGWTAAPPGSYTFASLGSHTLYTWARDAAGNVSLPFSAVTEVLLLQKGDANADGAVGLADAIMLLKVQTAQSQAAAMFIDADTDGDQKLAVGDALFILRQVAAE